MGFQLSADFEFTYGFDMVVSTDLQIHVMTKV